MSFIDTAEVFDFFCVLTSIAPEPGGLLCFYSELDGRGMTMAAAANIAGAASLGVDAHAERVKLALRNGICDFMVNHLNEALRILKNEIRKKQPVAVALMGDPKAVVAEMVARGVQPDLLLDGFEYPEFMRRGAKVFPEPASHDWVEVRWSVEQDPGKWLPRVDAVAIEMLTPSDSRVRWLRFAPRYLQKGLLHERFVKMSVDELERFKTLLQSEGIGIPVSVWREGHRVSN